MTEQRQDFSGDELKQVTIRLPEKLTINRRKKHVVTRMMVWGLLIGLKLAIPVWINGKCLSWLLNSFLVLHTTLQERMNTMVLSQRTKKTGC